MSAGRRVKTRLCRQKTYSILYLRRRRSLSASFRRSASERCRVGADGVTTVTLIGFTTTSTLIGGVGVATTGAVTVDAGTGASAVAGVECDDESGVADEVDETTFESRFTIQAVTKKIKIRTATPPTPSMIFKNRYHAELTILSFPPGTSASRR